VYSEPRSSSSRVSVSTQMSAFAARRISKRWGFLAGLARSTFQVPMRRGFIGPSSYVAAPTTGSVRARALAVARSKLRAA
jgi:hypothetical protein